MGIGAIETVKNHPWFADFDWEGLKERKLRPTFIPDIEKKNFNQAFVNNINWNDDKSIAENEKLLRR